MIGVRPDHSVRGESLNSLCRGVAAANGITAGQLLHACPDNQALRGRRRPLPVGCGGAVAATHEVRCAAETSPLTRLTSLTEVYLNAADPKLFEGIAELAAASDGNDIAILAFGDWEPEGECAVGGAALPLSKRRGGKDLALAVLNGDGSVMADVGVSVRSLA
jgi:hypothetical protein